ncbi:MAG: HAMP domain-containing histidine kinase [Anaerolineae bacterium]|nr:HAMP domain-containing histidine kinase [Anaerolineae bacterium]
MLIVDFKLTLFSFLLLLGGLLALVWIVARRRPWFDDDQVAVWQSFPLGIILLSPSNRLRFANRSAYRLLHAEPDVTATTSYAQLLQKIEADMSVQHFPLSLSPRLILDVWVGPLGASRLILLRDVSEQRRREKDSQLYWSSVSHELRTPLTSILSHLEVSRSENVPVEVQAHSLEIAHQQTQRLSNLIHGTLALERLKALAHLDKISVDIILVAEEAIAELILLAEAKSIGLDFHYHPPIPPVLGNPDKLKQLFINLLDNAIKYCQPGDSVTVSLTTLEDSVQCRVADTGAGIPAEHLPHLTQQFYRVRRDVPGSGLGLAIVAEIVRQHDGRLQIESYTEGDDKGTVIIFTLPILLTTA